MTTTPPETTNADTTRHRGRPPMSPPEPSKAGERYVWPLRGAPTITDGFERLAAAMKASSDNYAAQSRADRWKARHEASQRALQKTEAELANVATYANAETVRANAAEAKVAAVEALVDEWEADDGLSLDSFGQHLAGGAGLSCAEMLRAALAGEGER